MNRPVEPNLGKAIDGIQEHLANYAHGLSYANLPPHVVRVAKSRVIDTLGTLIGGFFGQPCSIARNLASKNPSAEGSTLLGTRIKVVPDMAALANATTARYLDMNDGYLWPGSTMGHPSDTLTPVLAIAEQERASGRDFITSIVLSYEVFLRMCDVFHNEVIDSTTFTCLSTAIAGSKLMKLSPDQIAHAISMAVVPNVVLKQVRTGHLSMFKATAAGQAGRSGVFAAMLARAGMEGPHLPFEGKSGWCDHVAHDRFSFKAFGGNGTSFKIEDTLIKLRPACGRTISSILAAEKIAPAKNVDDITRVTVEVYKAAKEGKGTGEHNWHPDSRETADHSIPYVVAASLIDGELTPRQFDDAHLWSPKLRGLMQKIEVVENAEFTRAYEGQPQEHRTRITVAARSGELVIGEAGAEQESMAAPKTDAQIEHKFRQLTSEVLGEKRANAILERLWHLEDMVNVADIPRLLAFC